MVEGVNKVPGPPYMNDASNNPKHRFMSETHVARLAKPPRQIIQIVPWLRTIWIEVKMGNIYEKKIRFQYHPLVGGFNPSEKY